MPISKREQQQLNELGNLGPHATNVLLLRILDQLEEMNKQLMTLSEKLGKA